MSRALDFLRDLEAARGANEKKAILRKLTDQDKRIMRWALDPALIYFFQADPKFKGTGSNRFRTEDDALDAFSELLDNLHHRKLTGNDAKEAVNWFLTGLPNNEVAMWFIRILNKDLKIGVEAKTYLSIHKGDFVIFECMLAEPYEDEQVMGWLADDKIDGLRALRIPTNDASAFFSRTGKLLFGNDHIAEELDRQPGLRGYVFDGEFFAGTWEDSVSQARTASATTSNLKYNIFDVLTLEEWNARKSAPLFERKARLKKLFDEYGTELPNCVHVGGRQIDANWTVEQAMSDACTRGHEGVVVKNPAAQYKWKRSSDWLKVKPRKEVDLTITGAAEGKPGTQYEGMLGAIVVDFKGVNTEIGTGFSNDQRKVFWEMYKNGTLVGMIAEIEMGPVTPDGKLFHASFKRLRVDK